MSVPHKPHYFLTLKKQTASFILQRQQRETKQKLGKHVLLQTKRQSHGRLTFPPAGARREKNVRVPNVLAAGALAKKHLQILSFSPPFFLSFTFQCRLFSIKEKASFLSPCFASISSFFPPLFSLFLPPFMLFLCAFFPPPFRSAAEASI